MAPCVAPMPCSTRRSLSVGESDEHGDSTGGAAAARVVHRNDLEPLTPEPFDGTTVVNMDAERPRRRRRPWRTALTAGGLAAMLGVVSLGVASLLGGGGANSPDGAVRQLADAIDNQDPLAAVDVLAPDEVGALRDSVDGISERAQQLQLVDDAGKPLSGVDFEVGDLQLDNEELAPGLRQGRHARAPDLGAGASRRCRRVDPPGLDDRATTPRRP